MDKQQIRNGLIDYLTIMQYAGVTDVSRLPVTIAPRLSETESPIISVTKNNETESNTDSNTVSNIVSNAISTEAESSNENATNEVITSNVVSYDEVVVETNLTNDSDIENNLSTNLSSDMKSSSVKSKRLKLLSDEVSCCVRCGELARLRTQTVFGAGNPDSQLMFIGEAPGADEDIQGEPFVGRSGKLLNDILTKGMKIDRKDVYICNILRCRPPNNRQPEPIEAANCKSFLERTIKIVNPKFICCLGTVATKYLLQTDKAIGQMRGSVHDYDGIKVVCTYHPSYLLRLPAAKKNAWEDIKLLMKIMEENR
ncbi:MAG: uracil-DNA glycosylase [Planctomycetaceae bacterium]|jgi:DNA polymerase|nr:uracil-DNA glycosylase [Planctomycetaceae bacterium]